MDATRDGVPIDNRDGRVLKCKKVKSLSGVRNALETAATPERQAVLFQRLFEHSNELELNRLRERLVSKKAEFYAARREYRQRISKPVSKRTKRDRAAITELLCVKDDLEGGYKRPALGGGMGATYGWYILELPCEAFGSGVQGCRLARGR